MKKIAILGIVAVLLLTLVGSTVMAKGGNDKAARGNLQEDAIVHAWQSHGDVGGNDAGAIILATGNIESIGKVDTELSMAYTWGFYSHNKNALLYGYAQSGAPTTLKDTKTYTPHPKDTPFDITYTFTATTKTVMYSCWTLYTE